VHLAEAYSKQQHGDHKVSCITGHAWRGLRCLSDCSRSAALIFREPGCHATICAQGHAVKHICASLKRLVLRAQQKSDPRTVSCTANSSAILSLP